MKGKRLTNHQKGGRQAAKTMKQRYGRDFHRRIGLKGGNPVLLAQSKKRKVA